VKPRIYVLVVFHLDSDANSLIQVIVVIKGICSWLPPWLDEYEESLFTETCCVDGLCQDCGVLSESAQRRTHRCHR